MLTRSPWKDLLPADVQAQLPLMVMREISPERQRPAVAAKPPKSSEPQFTVVSAAKELFDQTDKNKDGRLEEEELVGLCEQVSCLCVRI